MFHEGKNVLRISIIALIIAIIIGYSYFQSRNLIRGPQITLTSPLSGSTLASPLVAIKGSAQNIAFISLNNRQIYVDNNGRFNEELLLSPGYNIWTIEAKDKFGRIVSKKIELVLDKTL